MSTLEKIIGLKQETLENSITPKRLGGILEEMLNTCTTQSHSNSGEINEVVVKEVIPLNENTDQNMGTGNGVYSYQNSIALFAGKTIKSVKIKAEEGGTFTIMACKDFNKPTRNSFRTLAELNIEAGTKEYPINKKLEEDEWLIFRKETDNAKVSFISTSPNPIGGSILKIDNVAAKSAIRSYNRNLNIGVLIEETSSNIVQQNPLKGKKISIIGDSISTFQGEVPQGNAIWYPKADVTSKELTWWGKLIEENEMILEVNNSWSGSELGNSKGGNSPFTTEARWNNLGNPDIILVFGGINDFANNRTLGEFNTDTQDRDLSMFKQSYQYLVEKLQTNYKNSQLFLVVPIPPAKFEVFKKNTQNWKYQDLIKAVKDLAEMYCVKTIDLSKSGINFKNGDLYLHDGIHPNKKGMELMSNFVENSLKDFYE